MKIVLKTLKEFKIIKTESSTVDVSKYPLEVICDFEKKDILKKKFSAKWLPKATIDRLGNRIGVWLVDSSKQDELEKFVKRQNSIIQKLNAETLKKVKHYKGFSDYIYTSFSDNKWEFHTKD